MERRQALTLIYTKYRMIVFPIVVIISSLILIVFIIFPQLSILISTRTTEQDLLKKVNFLDVKAKTLITYDKELLDEQVKVVLSSYPTEEDFGNVLGILQNIGLSLGFSINSFGVGKANADKAGFSNYSIEISVSGPSSAFSSFLAGIEESNRIMRISAIDISQSHESSAVDGRISILAYFAPPPREFGKLDSVIPEITASDEATMNRLTENYRDVSLPVSTDEEVSTGNPNPFQ